MSAPKLLLALCLGALAGAARAAPRHVRSVELAAAVNRSVCPLRVEVDEDPDRVPSRIKLLKCAAEPSASCRREPAAHCCRRHGAHALECVELHDTVRVYYKSSARSATHAVAVGCACLVAPHADALGVPEGPT